MFFFLYFVFFSLKKKTIIILCFVLFFFLTFISNIYIFFHFGYFWEFFSLCLNFLKFHYDVSEYFFLFIPLGILWPSWIIAWSDSFVLKYSQLSSLQILLLVYSRLSVYFLQTVSWLVNSNNLSQKTINNILK